mmetsp:Transcript_13690/g.54176  ORF Transcript_13690/g.54176 Transcript_13690/m.54176 type:complete len:1072 (-) Transcript_13690:39-3254(-)
MVPGSTGNRVDPQYLQQLTYHQHQPQQQPQQQQQYYGTAVQPIAAQPVWVSVPGQQPQQQQQQYQQHPAGQPHQHALPQQQHAAYTGAQQHPQQPQPQPQQPQQYQYQPYAVQGQVQQGPAQQTATQQRVQQAQLTQQQQQQYRLQLQQQAQAQAHAQAQAQAQARAQAQLGQGGLQGQGQVQGHTQGQRSDGSGIPHAHSLSNVSTVTAPPQPYGSQAQYQQNTGGRPMPYAGHAQQQQQQQPMGGQVQQLQQAGGGGGLARAASAPSVAFGGSSEFSFAVSPEEIAKQQEILDAIARSRAERQQTASAGIESNRVLPQEVAATPLRAPQKKSRFGRFLPSDYLASLWGKGTQKPEAATSELGPAAPAEPPAVTAAKEEEQPFAVSSDGSSTGYFAYEMHENDIVKHLLAQSEESKAFIEELVTRQAILLIPQAVHAKKYAISDVFLKTHAITTLAESTEGSVFTTFNGIVGCFDAKRETISILDMSGLHEREGGARQTETKTSEPQVTHTLVDTSEDVGEKDRESEGGEKAAEAGKGGGGKFANIIVTDSGQEVSRLQLLREGQLHFPNTPVPVGIVLISDALWARDCDCLPELEEALTSPRGEASKRRRESSGGSGLPATTLQEQYKKKILHTKAKHLRLGIKKYIANFKKSPPPEEERGKAVLGFLASAVATIKANPLWINASQEELAVAELSITKTIFAQLFPALFAPKKHKEMDERLWNMVDKLWVVTPEHLDIYGSDWDESTWHFAKQELDSMNVFCTPREKLECLLNCCKIIISFLNSKGGVAGADDFLPHLIYAILYANPKAVHSNMEFIKSFCRPTDELAESFYYLTILESAVYFIENITGPLVDMPEDFYAALISSGIPRPATLPLTRRELYGQLRESKFDDPLPPLPESEAKTEEESGRLGPLDLLSDDEESPLSGDVLVPTAVDAETEDERESATTPETDSSAEAEETTEVSLSSVLSSTEVNQCSRSYGETSSDKLMLDMWEARFNDATTASSPLQQALDSVTATLSSCPSTYGTYSAEQLQPADVPRLLAEYQQLLQIVATARAAAAGSPLPHGSS